MSFFNGKKAVGEVLEISVNVGDMTLTVCLSVGRQISDPFHGSHGLAAAIQQQRSHFESCAETPGVYAARSDKRRPRS